VVSNNPVTNIFSSNFGFDSNPNTNYGGNSQGNTLGGWNMNSLFDMGGSASLGSGTPYGNFDPFSVMGFNSSYGSNYQSPDFSSNSFGATGGGNSNSFDPGTYTSSILNGAESAGMGQYQTYNAQYSVGPLLSSLGIEGMGGPSPPAAGGNYMPNPPASGPAAAGSPPSSSPPGGAPPTGSPPAGSPPAGSPPADGKNVQSGSVNGGGPNELVLKNTDSKPMTIALFENTGPGMNPNIDDPNHKYTIQPGQTLKLSMPSSWQGRAQKLGGKADDPATWAEINYEPGKDGTNNKIWYDESVIRGYNSAVTMKPTNSTNDADLGGSSKSIIDGAPSDAVTTDAGGNKVIKDPERYDGGTNQAAIDYLNSSVGNNNAYVRNWDHNAVRTTEDNSLTVTFGAA